MSQAVVLSKARKQNVILIFQLVGVFVFVFFSLQLFVFSTRFEPGSLEPKKFLQPSVTVSSSTPTGVELTEGTARSWVLDPNPVSSAARSNLT